MTNIYHAYKFDAEDDAEFITGKLNEFAAEGYRLVHAQGLLFVMEKPTNEVATREMMDEIRATQYQFFKNSALPTPKQPAAKVKNAQPAKTTKGS